MRCAIYARVSNAAQRERDTIASQLETLPKYARAQGWTVVDTYIDDGRSGATGKLDARDGFARMARDAAARRFDVVLCVDVNRLTRTEDALERAQILSPFQRAGIHIATPTAGVLDLRTLLGEMFVTFHALVAAEEQRKRSEAVQRGKMAAIAKGRKPAGKTPYGLTHKRLPDGTAAWGVDKERAAIVIEILERQAAGESSTRIARDFEIRRIPRIYRQPWTQSRVRDISVADYITGTWLVDERRGLTITVPAIATPELVERARKGREANRKIGLGHRQKHDYLLARLGVCGRCGQIMRVRSGVTTWRKSTSSQYRCLGRLSPLPPDAVRCDAPSVYVPDADEQAWTAISRELLDPALVPALLKIRSERARDHRDWSGDAAQYKRHLARLDDHETELLARRRRGLVSATAMDRELAALARERAMLAEQVSTAERAQVATIRATRRLADAEAIVGRLRERLATATPAERREIVMTLVDPGGVVFEGDRIRIELWIERPAVQAEDSTATLVAGQPWRDDLQTRLRIRVVAPVQSFARTAAGGYRRAGS